MKDTETELPWAENDTHWIMMGIHWDLDRAMRMAVEKTVDFLVTTQGLTVPKAYSFASIAVNYHAAEVVDRTQVVTGSSRRTSSGLAAEATQRRPVRSGCL